MLLYNVTVIVEDSSAEAWLQWMQEEHIPKVMATGLFISNRFLRVLDSPNEGVTYCSQYVAENITDYETFQQQFAMALDERLNLLFKNKLVSFSTLMEYIS